MSEDFTPSNDAMEQAKREQDVTLKELKKFVRMFVNIVILVVIVGIFLFLYGSHQAE